MAISPGHKFGQLIGEVLEMAIEPILSEFARKHGLYLDKKGPRPARGGQKVCWTDLNGNKHDLDFVLERGGTPDKFGTPVAFIEAAWRRYTKHSRNKAQEIQGAILPLFQTHERCHPFTGAFLAGVFTAGALKQLKSLGFAVAYFPYETVVQAFAKVQIDASFDESTADGEFDKKFKRWDALQPSNQTKVAKELARLNAGEIEAFIEDLHNTVQRRIQSVRIFPLHGSLVEWTNVHDAISFIQAYNEECGGSIPIVRYEVEIIYVNGDRIWGEFAAKNAAIDFLNSAYGAVPSETQNT
jgi:hypothetical protein